MARRESAVTGLSLRAAHVRDGGRTCEDLDLDSAVRAVREPGTPLWIDVVAHDVERTREILQNRMGLHELAVEDALSDQERPTLQEFDDFVFLVVPAVLRDGHDERYVEIGFFLNDHALVTVSREAIPLLDKWFERWRTRPGRLVRSPAYLLHALVDALVDGFFAVSDDIEDGVEEIGDALFTGHAAGLEEIVALKRRLMKLRRAVTPTRDVLSAILRGDMDEFPDDSDRYFQDVADHIVHVAETIDALRDALASMVGIHLSVVSQGLNVILKKMAVLATVLATMTLVAGIYGMNFDRMPELHWRYGYAFSYAVMFGLGGLVVWAFKRVRWI